MSSSKPESRPIATAVGLTLLLATAGVRAGNAPESPLLGRPAAAEEIAAFEIGVFPDGAGLPPGRGSATEGGRVYEAKCASCHGPKGIGGTAEELAGGRHSLTSADPDKNIGTYWPYATTLFDFVRRSMPLDAPRSLSNDEVYAVTAYLLYVNGILAENRVLDAASLPKIEMPNRRGFIDVYEAERAKQ